MKSNGIVCKKKTLVNLYAVKKLSLHDIAKIYNVGYTVIRIRALKYKIIMRDREASATIGVTQE